MEIIIMLGLVFFFVPVVSLAVFIINLVKFCKLKREIRIYPETVPAEELKKSRNNLIWSFLFVFVMFCMVCFVVYLFYGAIAYM